MFGLQLFLVSDAMGKDIRKDRQDLFVLGKSIVWNSQLLHIPFKNLQELSMKKLPYLSKWSVNLNIKKI